MKSGLGGVVYGHTANKNINAIYKKIFFGGVKLEITHSPSSKNSILMPLPVWFHAHYGSLLM